MFFRIQTLRLWFVSGSEDPKERKTGQNSFETLPAFGGVFLIGNNNPLQAHIISLTQNFKEVDSMCDLHLLSEKASTQER